MTRCARGPAAWLVAVAVVLGAVAPGFVAAQDTGAVAGGQALLMADSLFRIAKLKMKQGNCAEAEQNLRRLVALPFGADPKALTVQAAGFTVLVDSLVAQKKWDDALKTGLDALKLPCFVPPSVYKAELLKLLGKIYEAKGKMDLSEQYLKASLQIMEQLPKPPAGGPPGGGK